MIACCFLGLSVTLYTACRRNALSTHFKPMNDYLGDEQYPFSPLPVVVRRNAETLAALT